MFIAYTFTIEVNDSNLVSPVLGTGDMRLLKDLFPLNPIWDCRTPDVDNKMYPTIDQMKALYLDIAERFAEQGASSESFQTDFSGQFSITSSERMLFQDILGFCESQLGFKRPRELKQAMDEWEQIYSEEEHTQWTDFRTKALSHFHRFNNLKKIDDAILAVKLKEKLAEYETRLRNIGLPSCLAFISKRSYRDATYKKELLSSVLSLENGEELNLQEMASRALDKHHYAFRVDEYLNACLVIADYVGRPLEGGATSKGLI